MGFRNSACVVLLFPHFSPSLRPSFCRILLPYLSRKQGNALCLKTHRFWNWELEKPLNPSSASDDCATLNKCLKLSGTLKKCLNLSEPRSPVSAERQSYPPAWVLTELKPEHRKRPARCVPGGTAAPSAGTAPVLILGARTRQHLLLH